MNKIKRQFSKPVLLALLCIAFANVNAQTITDNLLKRNVTPISSPLQKLMLLEPRIFEYDTDQFKKLQLKQGKQYGFLADNVNEVFPGLVGSKAVSYMYGKNNYRQQIIPTINEVSLIPVMVASIQELHGEVERLKTALQELKNSK